MPPYLMDSAVSIPALRPELTGIDSLHIRAVVTLIWPYSSSARTFALLLADPDFRRRRKNGQVRVRFTGSGARSLASTGVGIGDEVVLGLRGAEFLRDSDVSTPGKSIDWELEYGQTLGARVIRDGEELAVLELDGVAPTPALASPVRATPRMERGATGQWNSPAYLKRLRLSNGPVLAPFDPFADDIEDGHASKRRRRSYRDWNAWTYLARTPSPEKEDTDVDMDGEACRDGSPIRPVVLPASLVSPPHTATDDRMDEYFEQGNESSQEVAQDLNGTTLGDVGEQSSDSEESESAESYEEHANDAKSYDLQSAPDRQPASQGQVIYLSDTETDTDEEVEDEEQQADFEVEEILSSDDEGSETQEPEVVEDIEEDSICQPEETNEAIEIQLGEQDHPTEELSSSQMQEIAQMPIDTTPLNNTSNDVPRIDIPPPPTLSLLQTDFRTPYVPGMLTPIGKEPSSPSIQPLDSSTLPMPSPFPGGREGNVSNYLDYVSTPQQSQSQCVAGNARQDVPEDEADYILETSFYSSVSSSRAPAFQPTHESAFTDVRFTFGMDGGAFSRPQTSGPAKADEMAPEGSVGARQSSAAPAGDVMERKSGPGEDDKMFDDFLASSPVASLKAQPFEPTEALVESSISEAGDAVASEPDNKVSDEQADQPQGEQPHGQPDSEMADEGGIIEEVTVEPSAIGKEHHHELNFSMAEFTHTDDCEQDYIDISGPTILDVEPDQAGSDLPTAVVDAELETAADDAQVLDSHTDNGRDREEEQFVAVPKVEIIDLSSSLNASDSEEDEPEYQDKGGLDQDVDNEVHSSEDELEQVYSESGTQIMLNHPSRSQSPGNNLATRPEVPELAHAETQPIEEIDMSQDPSVSDVHSTHEVKMESVEEGFDDTIQESDTQDDNNSTTGDNAQLLIEVPTEGHKVGELETVAVPDAVPARSTRSKTKLLTSPEKEAPVPLRSSRSRKAGSLAPLSQLSQRTISPPATRSRGTVTPTPTQESFTASPYSLRSQSKHLTPTKSSFASVKRTPTRKRSTKPGSSAEPSPQQAPFTQQSSLTDFDFPWTNFGPSQELGNLDNSQGKFSNVPYVKDSEEGSVRSEQSISTVQYSDDWSIGAPFSDPPVPDTQVKELSSTPRKTRTASRQLTSPVTPGQETGTRVTRKTRSASKQSASPFASQLQSSPTKSVHSAASLSVATSSLRRSRRAEEQSAGFSAASDRAIEMESSHAAPSEVDETDIYTPSSPQPESHRLSSFNERSILPVTPEATQHTLSDSHPSHLTPRPQNLPTTPRLTQSLSAAHRTPEADSFEAEGSTLIILPPNSKMTPRRNATATDVVSPSASPNPSLQSASDEEAADVAELQKPSIGLSTPVAYYTPLKDLPYFINRSSSFHSAGFPDVLALVTTTSTPPTRATKGPKHHTTTLHITDLSLYPVQTTVQIFRAYADALPIAEAGDVVLLRAFNVKSLNRHPCLISGDESAWCVWRYGKPLWGKKRGAFSEVRSREEVKGPAVERGEGEWGEVEKVRGWWAGFVKGEVEEKARVTRSRDKDREGEGAEAESQVLEYE